MSSLGSNAPKTVTFSILDLFLFPVSVPMFDRLLTSGLPCPPFQS